MPSNHHFKTWLGNCLIVFLGCVLICFPAQAGSGTALRYDGTNSYVQLSSSAAFNAFPLTVTAWVRTVDQDAQVRGVVSKYVDGSFNGWTLFFYSGHIRAFYFRNSSSYVWDGGLGLDGGLLADGAWHHVALVVDASGGRLIVDGVQKASRAWTGTAGVSSSADPLQIGRYNLYPTRFHGDIDEVSVWNQTLDVASLNYIKHRRLAGGEDGLVALWHFDEGSGATATDSSASALVASLVGSPQWVTSTAPLPLSPVAATALKCNGVNAQAVMPHVPAQDTLPITLMAWVKTSQSTGAYPGIVTKYVGNSVNGYAIGLNAGRIDPWYYASGTSFIDPGFTNASDRFVADGQWHHIAFVVDTSTGRTYIDGQLVNTQPWTGTPAAVTTTESLRLGAYTGGGALFFNGSIDHVSLWNTALTSTDINRYSHLPLAGTESGLISAYEMNEASGTTINDLTGLANGIASGGFTRVGSLARVGDASQYLLGSLDVANYGRSWAIQNSPNFQTFPLNAQASLWRFYDYGDAPTPVSVSTFINPVMTNASSQGVPLKPTSMYSNLYILDSYNASSPLTPTAMKTITTVINVEPQGQLQSVSQTYSTAVAFSHQVISNPVITDEVSNLPLARFLHFNGNLFFGSIQTVFTSIANTPVAGAPSSGGLTTQLAVNNNSGSLVTRPDHHYGNGSLINSIIFDNGDALTPSASVPLTGSVPDTDCIQNICFTRTNINLTSSGINALVSLQLPLGFSVGTSLTSRATSARIDFPNIPLDLSLNPQNSVLTTNGPWYAVEETKPFWVGAPNLKWLPSAGQVLIDSPNAIYFVRQDEDDVLLANKSILKEPETANRVSNDGYYRNAALVAGAQVTVTADTNGFAQMSAQVALNPPELRPHFPYSGRIAGAQTPTTSGGRLSMQNGRIDTTNSYLALSGAVPLSYARDCSDTNCSSATISAAVLNFSPNGQQLTFTVDGGLLGFGSVPAQNLTWGFAGGSIFAQRTSDVGVGAYHMPGTFLRFDQTSSNDPNRPSTLLLTGVGNQANPNYIERPGQAAYLSGFANYAGANFRAPAQGRSIIGGQDTGFYPLTARAKYYVRAGGVSGIHEAATFPSNLNLYGYAFTFISYRLSYLDSENWESRTDGALALPVPAGFTQEFARMKFVCRGGLDSAQVPPSSGVKHLVYWNSDITPQTIEFRPTASDTCGTGARFLVEGVETRLPFIPQAFHATLGFKPNGNMVAPFDNVAGGADSRFPVPAQLTLQGSGGSTFKLSTVAEGYFNNWETVGKPDSGFYNLTVKIRTPFFEDVKAQLHITPTGTNTSQMAMMGGWPAADGLGQNRGWNVGTQNYFNTSKFDPHSDGWPAGAVTIAQYRNSPTEDYHPRAQRDWIEVAKFDYPLQWNAVLRNFAGFVDAKVELPVLDVNSRLKEITPGKVDFDFAQDISVQLPRIKVLDFANDALNEINQPLNTISNAISQELGAALASTGLTSGFRSLQNTLREDASGFFRPIVQPALDPVVDKIYAALTDIQRTNPAVLLTSVYGVVGGVNSGLNTAINGLNGSAGQANSVLGKMNGTLNDVDDTLNLFIRALEKDSKGQRHVVRAIIQKLVEDQGPALGFVANMGDDAVNQLLTDLEPTLAEAEQQLRDVRAQFSQLRGSIAAGTGDFSSALTVALNDSKGLQQFTGAAGLNVSNLLVSLNASSTDYLTGNPAQVKQAIRERLTVAFLGSPLVGNYQKSFRQFLYDDDFALNQLTDVIFGQINKAIRDGLTSQIASATDGAFQNFKGGGFLSKAMLSAKLRGAPTFNGDSLRRIHIDADVQMNLPDEMHFTAFLDIKELDSDNTPLDCIPAGPPAAEITVGALNVPLSWTGIPGNLTLSIEGKWTVQSGNVLGVGGLIDIKGHVGFKGCSINEIGATFAVGELENFFAAKAAGTITIIGVPVNVQAGLFAGHACSLDPLRFIDPEADKVLDHATEFTGLYIAFGGDISLSDILFGESSCALDITIGVTTATYYQDGPRSGKIGMRQKVSGDASLLCIISAHVDVALGTSISSGPSGLELMLKGEANVCGEIGYCPFCVDGCIGATLTGIVNDGGIDYSFDF
ncbi:LamG domain-containing protein [Pedosphaera parvula]|uniref:Laminin G sub domain 2 n=1 Tax=Pedosphaera parvula (strain Ellin514) TaxID=320771 RepID=B9XMI8_PEDPL|nr:LamG domain-containing protein [Pedosphaera parvula]EEF58887.1 Laminin G sub domain 2 [Pedosphaera parvula Ellin514]